MVLSPLLVTAFFCTSVCQIGTVLLIPQIVSLGWLTVKLLGASDRLGSEKVTDSDDVTDWCVSILALYWLASSLMDQQKHDEAINIFEEQLEIEKQLVPVREASTGAG